MRVHLSLVVPTHNRAESLKETLASVNRQSAPEIWFEIIVIDNNSSDHTRAAVREFAKHSRWPVKYIFEPRQGVSHARNTGLEASGGDIVGFADDDVILKTDWVHQAWRAFQDPGVDALGGRVLIRWDCERPAWMAEEISGPVISQDRGPARAPWTARMKPLIGANMAFRREVFERHGTFDVALGRSGAALLGGEDYEFFRRIAAGGARVWYEPSVIAWHKVTPQRLSKNYLRRWYRDSGVTTGHTLSARWYHRLSVAPLWVWSNVLGSGLRYSRTHLQGTGDEAEVLASELMWRFHTGMLRERFAHWLSLRPRRKRCVMRRLADESKQGGTR